MIYQFLIPPDSTPIDIYEDSKSTISIALDVVRIHINIETRKIRDRFTKRHKRLSGSTIGNRQGDYVCFKSKDVSSYCVNVKEDEEQNILLTLKILKNVEDEDMINKLNKTEDINVTTQLNASVSFVESRKPNVSIVELVKEYQKPTLASHDMDVISEDDERKYKNMTHSKRTEETSVQTPQFVANETLAFNLNSSLLTSTRLPTRLIAVNLNKRKLGFPIFSKVALPNITNKGDGMPVEKNDVNNSKEENKMIEQVNVNITNDKNIKEHEEKTSEKSTYSINHSKKEEKSNEEYIIKIPGKYMIKKPIICSAMQDKNMDENEKNVSDANEYIFIKIPKYSSKFGTDINEITNEENISDPEKYLIKKNEDVKNEENTSVQYRKITKKLETDTDEVTNEENIRDQKKYFIIKSKYSSILNKIEDETNEDYLSARDIKTLDNLKYLDEQNTKKDLIFSNEENVRAQTENKAKHNSDILDKNLERFLTRKEENFDPFQPIIFNDLKHLNLKDKNNLYNKANFFGGSKQGKNTRQWTRSDELKLLDEESMKEMELMNQGKKKKAPTNSSNIQRNRLPDSQPDESFDEKYQILAFIKHDRRTTTTTEEPEQMESNKNDDAYMKALQKQMEEQIKDRLFRSWLIHMQNLTQSNPAPDQISSSNNEIESDVSYQELGTKNEAQNFENNDRENTSVPNLKPFQRIIQSNHDNAFGNIDEDQGDEDEPRTKSFLLSIARTKSNNRHMPHLEIIDNRNSNDVISPKHDIHNLNLRTQSIHRNIPYIETNEDHYPDPVHKHSDRYQYQTKPNTDTKDQDSEYVSRHESFRKAAEKVQTKYRTKANPAHSSHDGTSEELSGNFVNLNQGYFRNSPRSWESYDNVYHIRQ